MRNFLRKLAYNDTEKDFFVRNCNEIGAANSKNTMLFGIFSVVFMGILVVLSLLFSKMTMKNTYLLFFAIFLGYSAVAALFGRAWQKSSLALCYIFMSAAYMFGIIVGIFLSPSTPTVMFHMIMIATTSLIFDMPIRVFSFNLVWTAAAIYLSLNYKHSSVVFDDVINHIFTFAVTCCVSWRLIDQHVRLLKSRIEFDRLSRTDDLTALHNRRSFNIYIANYFKKNADNIYLLMIDVDYFKFYNDTYGHIEGDLCLEQLSALFSKYSEKYGYFFSRFGGDEFIATNDKLDCITLSRTVKELLDDVRALGIENSFSPYKHITLSIGCAGRRECGCINEIELINKADEALYRAKLQGRNCFCILDK